MKVRVSHPYQSLMKSHAYDHRRCALWAGMGMGKTSEAISIFDGLRMAGEVTQALVLAPLRVAQSTWPDELKKWQEFEIGRAHV